MVESHFICTDFYDSLQRTRLEQPHRTKHEIVKHLADHVREDIGNGSHKHNKTYNRSNRTKKYTNAVFGVTIMKEHQ